MEKTFKNNTSQGFALLLAIIISSVVLAIGLTILSVTLKQLSLSTTSRESEIAFQMARVGMECGQYWRAKKRSAFESSSSNLSDFENISCGGTSNISHNDSNGSTVVPVSNIDGSAYINDVTYRFDVPIDSIDRCVESRVYVVDNSDPAAGTWTGLVGRLGMMECDAGGSCTFVVAQGYNRSCAEVGSGSLFAVQREITAEY